MTRSTRPAARAAARSLGLLQILLLVLSPGCVHPSAIDPVPGVLEYRAPLRRAVAGGVVDVGGGNLVIRRVDLSIDTRVTTVEVGAVYNSSTGAWTRSFASTYDGSTFVDETGAVHDVAAVAPGDAVPGTHWVRIDATHMATKGGLVHAFDPVSHRLQRVSWGVGAWPALVYDVAVVSGSVRVVGLSQCDAPASCQSVYDVAYDANGCLERITDRAGRMATFTRDVACRPLVARDARDVAAGWPGHRYEYRAGRLHALTNSEDERTVYEHLDGRLVLVRALGDGARLVRFDYGTDAATGLHFTRVHDERGETSVYRYDAEGRLRGHVDAVGDETLTSWSGRRPTQFRDAAGAVTAVTYQDDDPVSIALPSGNVVTLAYAAGARDRRRPFARPLARVDDALGLVEARTYDAGGWLETVENGAGEVTGFGRGPAGEVTMIASPDGTITWLEAYGEHGRPARALRGTWVDHREYDAVGNPIEGADLTRATSPGRPGVRKLVYDEDRHVARIERVGRDALGDVAEALHVIEIERRSDGRPTRIVRPYGGETVFVYDGFGDLVERRERIDGVLRSTFFERDGAGDLIAVARPNGMRREITRDALGRAVGVTLVDDGVVVQTLEIGYAAGRLVRRHDSVHGADEWLVYDGAGRVVEVVHPGGERTELGYDLRSREIRRRFRMAPGAAPLRTLERVYDGADREIDLLEDGLSLVSRRFAGGRVDEITHANGLVERFDHDATLGMRTGWRLEPVAGGAPVAETTLGWASCAGDSLCVTSRTDVPGGVGAVPYGITYEGYRLGPMPSGPDPLGTPGARLETWVQDDAVSSLEPPSADHVFDALGNWLGVVEAGAPRRAMQFDAERNHILSVSGDVDHTYAWDEAGFLTARDGETVTWSPNGRPTAIGAGVSFVWDVLGRPVSSTIDGLTTTMRFGGEIVADAAGVPLELDLGSVSIDLVTGARLHRHEDFRGNVHLVTDDAGEVVLQRAYGPFGVEQTLGDGSDDRTFAGGTALGDLVMIGARLYDPAVGRFLSPDPVFQLVNQFAYTTGNPVFLWDPTGAHAEPNVNYAADIAEVVGIIFVSVGATLFIAAALSGAVPLALLGAALMVGGGLIILYARWSRGSVRLEDCPCQGHAPAGRASPRPSSSVGSELGCSPSRIVTDTGHGAKSLGVVILQVAVALAIARRRRRGGLADR